jgi:hypothetical protein
MKSPDINVRGKASCDFAELIWSGAIHERIILSCLQDNDPVIRAEVAWAVADGHRPTRAVDWLIQNGVTDVSERVRYWATKLVLELPEVDRQVLEAVQRLRNDESDAVRRNVGDILRKWKTES